jgi:transcriptional regulator with XRE-family HTH domain
MDDIRFGSVVRRLRIRAGLRQLDLAAMRGVSPSTISRIERGHLSSVSVATLRRVAAGLEIRLDLVPRWRGGDLDRLRNSRHSILHEAVARDLAQRPGWIFRPEVSFAIWGERGVVDVLAFHPGHRALLVIELKTEVVDVNDLVGTLDRKARLAVEIAATCGWSVPRDVTVSAWVIVAPGRTNRRRIHAHQTMLRAAYPLDGRSVAGWLAKPDRSVRCLSFWPDSHRGTVGTGQGSVRRVQARRGRVIERGSTLAKSESATGAAPTVRG